MYTYTQLVYTYIYIYIYMYIIRIYAALVGINSGFIVTFLLCVFKTFVVILFVCFIGVCRVLAKAQHCSPSCAQESDYVCCISKKVCPSVTSRLDVLVKDRPTSISLSLYIYLSLSLYIYMYRYIYSYVYIYIYIYT